MLERITKLKSKLLERCGRSRIDAVYPNSDGTKTIMPGQEKVAGASTTRRCVVRRTPHLGRARSLCLTAGTASYICPVIYTTVRGMRGGCRHCGQAKRGAALLPDSARLERTDPFRPTETGRVNAFGAGNSGAAWGKPDDSAAGAQVVVQPGTGVQPAREGNVCFADEAGEEFSPAAFVQRRNEGSRVAAAVQSPGVRAHSS